MTADLRTQQAWDTIHQPSELDWWKKNIPTHGNTQEPGFTRYWSEVREWIGVHGRVLDIGCGPRPPFMPCDVIEPLANEYRKITPFEWWHGVGIIAQPAEAVPISRNYDTVICWNCIDHCFNWRGVLDTMLAAGLPKAKYAISTDFWTPFTGHPGVEGRETFMAEIEKRFEVVKTREEEPNMNWRQLSLLMVAKENAPA